MEGQLPCSLDWPLTIDHGPVILLQIVNIFCVRCLQRNYGEVYGEFYFVKNRSSSKVVGCSNLEFRTNIDWLIIFLIYCLHLFISSIFLSLVVVWRAAWGLHRIKNKRLKVCPLISPRATSLVATYHCYNIILVFVSFGGLNTSWMLMLIVFISLRDFHNCFLCGYLNISLGLHGE